MTYSSITNWNTTEWNDALETLAQDKFLPMILAAGAQRAQMVRTGDLTFSVITEYADAKAADPAQAKIAGIRETAAEELPMTMASAAAGVVFASS